MNLAVALELKTTLKQNLQWDECRGVLLMPLAMSILQAITVAASPNFAAAVILSGIN